MELRHLRYFVAVAELGSLARAARQLNVAQSALSQQIQDLERELGAPLLDRLPRGMRATPAGRAFLEHARRSLAEADAGAQIVRQVAAGDSGIIRIGTADWGTHAGRVGDAVACLRARAPGASVVFDPTAWPEQPPAIAAGRIDVGFCPAVHASDLPAALHAEPLGAEPVDHVLIASTHPLAGRDVVSLGELAGTPLLLPERAVYPAMYDHCVAEVRRAGREPPIITAPSSPAAAVGLVASGAGFILAMRSFALTPPPGTAGPRLAEWSLRVQLFALRRRSDERAIVLAFLDCLCAGYRVGPHAGQHAGAPSG